MVTGTHSAWSEEHRHSIRSVKHTYILGIVSSLTRSADIYHEIYIPKKNWHHKFIWISSCLTTVTFSDYLGLLLDRSRCSWRLARIRPWSLGVLHSVSRWSPPQLKQLSFGLQKTKQQQWANLLVLSETFQVLSSHPLMSFPGECMAVSLAVLSRLISLLLFWSAFLVN